jgi:hypothetical protein
MFKVIRTKKLNNLLLQLTERNNDNGLLHSSLTNVRRMHTAYVKAMDKNIEVFTKCLLSGRYFIHNNYFYIVKSETDYKDKAKYGNRYGYFTGYYTIHSARVNKWNIELDSCGIKDHLWNQCDLELVDKEVLEHFELELVDVEV